MRALDAMHKQASVQTGLQSSHYDTMAGRYAPKKNTKNTHTGESERTTRAIFQLTTNIIETATMKFNTQCSPWKM